MRRCSVSVAGIDFVLKYSDFLYELMSAVEANTGLHLSSIRWNGGDKYLATISGGELLPIEIYNDRRCR